MSRDTGLDMPVSMPVIHEGFWEVIVWLFGFRFQLIVNIEIQF